MTYGPIKVFCPRCRKDRLVYFALKKLVRSTKLCRSCSSTLSNRRRLSVQLHSGPTTNPLTLDENDYELGAS